MYVPVQSSNVWFARIQQGETQHVCPLCTFQTKCVCLPLPIVYIRSFSAQDVLSDSTSLAQLQWRSVVAKTRQGVYVTVTTRPNTCRRHDMASAVTLLVFAAKPTRVCSTPAGARGERCHMGRRPSLRRRHSHRRPRRTRRTQEASLCK